MAEKTGTSYLTVGTDAELEINGDRHSQALTKSYHIKIQDIQLEDGAKVDLGTSPCPCGPAA